MSKIEVGEYVRTDNGEIKLVTQELKDFIDEYESLTEKGFVEFLGRIKHSKQLIDLIEEGDYVNGYRVINEGSCPCGECVDIDSNKDSSKCTLREEDIKTILTHEQFEANCYNNI